MIVQLDVDVVLRGQTKESICPFGLMSTSIAGHPASPHPQRVRRTLWCRLLMSLSHQQQLSERISITEGTLLWHKVDISDLEKTGEGKGNTSVSSMYSQSVCSLLKVLSTLMKYVSRIISTSAISSSSRSACSSMFFGDKGTPPDSACSRASAPSKLDAVLYAQTLLSSKLTQIIQICWQHLPWLWLMAHGCR